MVLAHRSLLKETTYFSLVNENLWARLGDSRTAVRRSMYALVSACCRHAPGLLRPHPPVPAAKVSSGDPAEEGETEAVSDAGGKKEKAKRRDGEGVAGKRSRVATPGLLVELLSEKEDSNHREAWQAVLLVLREFKETWMAEKGAAVSRTCSVRPWMYCSNRYRTVGDAAVPKR